MIHRIEIASKVADSRAQVKKKTLAGLGFAGKIKAVFLADVYSFDKDFTKIELPKIAAALANPVSQVAFIDKPSVPPKFNWAIEIGFLPGVTDNVAATTKEIVEDLLKIKFATEESAYTSQLMFIKGKLSEKEAKEIAESLSNPLIQRIHLKSFASFKKEGGMNKIVPKVKLAKKPQVDIVNLDVSDEELLKIGKEGIVNTDGTKRGPLALDLTYMKSIQKYFQKKKRNPTDVELESIAQTWSEHCKHTIFADPIDEIKNGLFKTYIKKATEEIRSKKGKDDFCVSVFKDNSGAIKFDENYLATHKVETHNSPSALDPFGGSITGILGVNRDAIGFGLGAKPIANTYGFCFGNPKDAAIFYRDRKLTQKKLSSLRILEGVVAGVNSGGNCSGIPTSQGFVCFDDSYRGKPLVFVGTVGLIPQKNKGRSTYIKKAWPEDLIVMIGGRVGLDGIHGATFSSEASHSGSPATAVQIGDPITQKKLSDALVKEARDLGLFHSLTDNGAGGLSCSVAEMAKESGGSLVNLEKVPLKYPGLAPWQIWISESQERMTLAVPKNKWRKLEKLLSRHGVEATIIGQFTASGRCLVKYHQQTVMDVEMKFLHDGLPKRPMKTTPPPQNFPEPSIPLPKDLNKTLRQMLSRPNIAGFSFISQQYDHEVQGGSVIKPLQGKGRINGEATIVRPVLNSQKGLVISQGVMPHFSQIDTYHMAACSIDTAIRNAVAAGANPNSLALLDNFCWCSSQEPQRLWQLKKAVQACYDYAFAFGTPFISGKDSMFNDFKGFDEKGTPIEIAVLPTLLVSSLGVVNDIQKTISLDPKFPGDLIYILGETKNELAGSEYYASYQEIGRNVPKVNACQNLKIYQSFYQAGQKGLLASAISLTRGGLGIGLAKMALAGGLGLEISLKNLPGEKLREDLALFSESQGRILVTVNPKKQKDFEKQMRSLPFAQIGKVTEKNLFVIKAKDNKAIIDSTLNQLWQSYHSTFKNY